VVDLESLLRALLVAIEASKNRQPIKHHHFDVSGHAGTINASLSKCANKGSYHLVPERLACSWQQCSSEHLLHSHLCSKFERKTSVSPIVLILVIILLLSLFGSGYGYRRGNNAIAGGGGIVGLLLVVLIVLFLMGRI
jgi:hypothetical protein